MNVPICVQAAEAGPEDEVCTITLQVKYNGTDINSGELDIYKVADLHTEGNTTVRYSYTGGFAAFASYTSDKLTAAKLTAALTDGTLNNSVLSSQMKSYVNERGIKALASAPITAGKAVFGSELGMTAGLYLVLQNDAQASEGYMPLDPFLITLPGFENGQAVYDQTAVPKTSLVPRETPPPEPPTPTPPAPEPPTPTPPVPTTPGTPPTPQVPPSQRTVLGAMRPTGGMVLGASRLPQTGQLWWPVPVLFIAGLALTATGRKVRTSQEAEGSREQG